MKITKKIITGLLAAVITATALPAEFAFATAQLPVPTFTITPQPTLNNYQYDFIMTWSPAPVSGSNTAIDSYTGTDVLQYATTYGIFSRNASLLSSTAYPSDAQPPATGDNQYRVNAPAQNDPTIANTMKLEVSPDLDPGCLYVWKAVPYHTHYGANNSTTYVKGAVTPGMETIFMSDIQVSATATFDSVTATWSNPCFDRGTQIFTGYKITVGELSGNVITGPSKIVNFGDPALLTVTAGDRTNLTYTMPMTLDLSKTYIVQVEPMFGTSAASPQKITINGTPYNFTLNPLKTFRSEAVVRPPLDYREIETSKLQLYWDALSTVGFNLNGLDLYQAYQYDAVKDELINPTLIATIEGNYPKDITSYILDSRPDTVMYYRYRLYYTAQIGTNAVSGYVDSEVCVYNPSALPFDPIKPTILNAARKPDDTSQPPASIDLTWQAFQRPAITSSELAAADANGMIIDKDVTYHIWVTDDLSNFDDPSFDYQKVAIIQARSLSDTTYNGKPAYTANITGYVSVEDGQYVLKPVSDNTVYYFRVRITRDADPTKYADSYYVMYIPPYGPIVTNPLSIGKPPLMIKKDPVTGADMITLNSITITWNTQWVELYNDADKSFYSEVAVDSAGNLLFGKDITDAVKQSGRYVNLADYNNLTDAKAAFAKIYTGATDQSLFYFRLMDITGTDPRIHVVSKDVVDAAGGYDAYVQSLLDQDSDMTAVNSIWTPITPTGDPAHPEYTVTQANSPAGPLQQNTPYVIIFRPFISTQKGILMAYYPNYVVGTTLNDNSSIQVTPTVPTIQPVSETGTSLTVEWEYKDGFGYVLSYAELASQYPGAGITVNIPANMIQSNQIGKLVTRGGKTYFQYTVQNLFPETIYYLWVRSATAGSQGTIMSDWSNPIMMTTSDLTAPQPPSPGLASPGELDIINKANNQSLVPIAPDYMIIEWQRDENDPETPDGKTGTTTGGTVTALSNPDIIEFYLAQFTGLTANKAYFVRAKTILTVTKGASGAPSTSAYSYVVQMSLSADFKDFTEFTIPAPAGGTGGQSAAGAPNSITKESAWSPTVYFITSPSTGEYDGDKNAKMYPLPTSDFEFIYYPESDTLYIRLRSNGTAQDGSNDNLVDQRFISKLISDKTYNYLLDASTYNGKPVTNAVAEFPYSVISTFDERKISLTVQSGATSVTFKPGFTQTGAVNALTDKGPGTSVTISLKGKSYFTAPQLPNRGTYLTDPKKLELTYKTPKSTVSITTAAQPMNVSLKASNRSAEADSNIGGYVSTTAYSWERQNSAFDNVTGTTSFATSKVGAYSAISVAPPASTQDDFTASQSMTTVQSLMNITDVNYYYPEALTSANQLNKLLAAVAKNSKDVAINSPLTDAEKTSLQKAGMYISSDKTVTREAAVDAIIKLYELKTKKPITNYGTAASSPYTDISSISPQYQTAFLKAAKIGLFDGSKARPKEDITLTETLQALDVVILDAGM